MRLLVQRVLEAAVTVDGQTTGAIGKGLLVMTGFGDEDGPDFHHSPVFEGMARKLLDLRIFPGEGDRCDKFDRSARDCGADVLLVPQFTLYADCRKGRRPSFSNAGDPAWSREMFDRFTQKVSEESGRCQYYIDGIGKNIVLPIISLMRGLIEYPHTVEGKTDKWFETTIKKGYFK